VTTAAFVLVAQLFVFSEAATDSAGVMWVSSLLSNRETAKCAMGHVQGDTTYVTDLYTMPILASPYTVRYFDEGCRKRPDYLGIVHTHFQVEYWENGADDACLFSFPDRYGFMADTLRADFVLCGFTRGRAITRAMPTETPIRFLRTGRQIKLCPEPPPTLQDVLRTLRLPL
jgi:hypothetical protein